jgi:glucose/mannose transport system permease protein
MALYLAGLRGLPETIRESAQLDGANEFIYYWKIAIPNMRPITMSAVIVVAHISLKLFDLIYAMAGADNANTGHPSINMYLTTFRANNFAVGAAISVVLFVLAALFIVPYLIDNYRTRRAG